MLNEFKVMVNWVYVFQEDNGDYSYVERIRIPLAHGTLLLMEGCTQEDWQVLLWRNDLILINTTESVNQSQKSKHCFLAKLHHKLRREPKNTKISLVF